LEIAQMGRELWRARKIIFAVFVIAPRQDALPQKMF
jgi:hypothetical protein